MNMSKIMHCNITGLSLLPEIQTDVDQTGGAIMMMMIVKMKVSLRSDAGDVLRKRKKRRNEIVTDQQGNKVSGCYLGHPHLVTGHLDG